MSILQYIIISLFEGLSSSITWKIRMTTIGFWGFPFWFNPETTHRSQDKKLKYFLSRVRMPMGSLCSGMHYTMLLRRGEIGLRHILYIYIYIYIYKIRMTTIGFSGFPFWFNSETTHRSQDKKCVYARGFVMFRYATTLCSFAGGR